MPPLSSPAKPSVTEPPLQIWNAEPCSNKESCQENPCRHTPRQALEAPRHNRHRAEQAR